MDWQPPMNEEAFQLGVSHASLYLPSGARKQARRAVQFQREEDFSYWMGVLQMQNAGIN